jgi:hypothetical protein
MVLLVIKSGASTAWSESSADIQIDLWKSYLTNNGAWVFSHEIKELNYKLLIVICRLCIYVVSFTLLVHMYVLRE